MDGDARTRHCRACKLNVYDLSQLTADESHALIEKTEGRVCVRLWRRTDGTVITADCPRGIADRARRHARILMAELALLACGLLGSAAFFSSGPGQRFKDKVVLWLQPPPTTPAPPSCEVVTGMMIASPPPPTPAVADPTSTTTK